MRRLTNPSTYEVITARARYAVVLERGKNTNAGTPKFKAQIITLEVFGEYQQPGYFFTVAYSFKGHYLNEAGEAAEVVRQHEEILKNKEV